MHISNQNRGFGSGNKRMCTKDVGGGALPFGAGNGKHNPRAFLYRDLIVNSVFVDLITGKVRRVLRLFSSAVVVGLGNSVLMLLYKVLRSYINMALFLTIPRCRPIWDISRMSRIQLLE
jgi:hypothetical protein